MKLYLLLVSIILVIICVFGLQQGGKYCFLILVEYFYNHKYLNGKFPFLSVMTTVVELMFK